MICTPVGSHFSNELHSSLYWGSIMIAMPTADGSWEVIPPDRALAEGYLTLADSNRLAISQKFAPMWLFSGVKKLRDTLPAEGREAVVAWEPKKWEPSPEWFDPFLVE